MRKGIPFTSTSFWENGLFSSENVISGEKRVGAAQLLEFKTPEIAEVFIRGKNCKRDAKSVGGQTRVKPSWVVVAGYRRQPKA